MKAALDREYQRAKSADRTAQSYETWRAGDITQVAAAWVLSCVFVRFLEDNELVDPPRIAGPGERLSRARDEHELYFRAYPEQTDREYLLKIFSDLASLPGGQDIFGKHNPIHKLPNWMSGDMAGELLTFFQKIDADTGTLIHDFTDDETWDTRFLGDLYQDLSEAVQKKYALKQTPEFVESFILDYTLEPAIQTFGFQEVRLIDPTCGSGHFLLGAFQRLLNQWFRSAPGMSSRELVQRALDAVYGVDLNPYAVAIAHFRLLIAALKASEVSSLRQAPGFRLHVAAGDSLLHGRRFGELALEGESVDLRHIGGLEHVYYTEDLPELNRILGQQYHVVVGNPPYINVRDKALNQAYRRRYSTCYQKYSLGVPFTERFFQLTIYGDSTKPAGYIGMITANSFMKREFGKKLIQEFLSHIDLSHVIDTSGAYIPGHGTPTVMLLGRHRLPVSSEVRAVLGIRGEPSTPDHPLQGQVWQSIVNLLDCRDSQNEFVTVVNMARDAFADHPWSIGGGGATDLKDIIEKNSATTLIYIADLIGITSVTGEDDLYVLGDDRISRRLCIELIMPLLRGESVRDWGIENECAIWLYDKHYEVLNLKSLPYTFQYFWPFRAAISYRKRFGTPIIERGLRWYEYQELYANKLRTPFSIAFAEIASHNHFVFDRGGKVFNRTAPVIKLPIEATKDDHFALLGLLNSSTACFWMKQVAHQKQMTGGDGIRIESKSKVPYAFSGTQLKRFPIPSKWNDSILRKYLVDLASQSDDIANTLG